MTPRHYSRKSDANQQQIMDELRQLGVSVRSIHRLGEGLPDLLCGFQGRNYLLEVKQPGKRDDLTEAEAAFSHSWRGQTDIITTTEEAWDIIRGAAW